MQLAHQSSLANKEAQLQNITELHKDDPKTEQFVTEALGLNFQLLHQK